MIAALFRRPTLKYGPTGTSAVSWYILDSCTPMQNVNTKVHAAVASLDGIRLEMGSSGYVTTLRGRGPGSQISFSPATDDVQCSGLPGQTNLHSLSPRGTTSSLIVPIRTRRAAWRQGVTAV